MEILDFFQARKQLVREWPTNLDQKILTISGRAREWIGRVAQCVGENPDFGEVEIVELSGMGREVLKQVPREEWVWLINPSLAPQESHVVAQNIVVNRRLFSLAWGKWLMAQDWGRQHLLSEQDWTTEEARVVNCLWRRQETVVSREEVAEAMWQGVWCERYSDWGIDTIVSRIRKKMAGVWELVTVKGRGYMLLSRLTPTKAPQKALGKSMLTEIPASIYPTEEYLTYMNDPNRARKVYADLFVAVKQEDIELPNEVESILSVNSYSYDNVDAVYKWMQANKWGEARAYFVHYDPRAVLLHLERIKELGLEGKMEAWQDDMRESKIKNGTMDIVINDFRLNFNQDDRQNLSTLCHTRRILRQEGVGLFSTVVDGRYENSRYGKDQEKAPLNIHKPGLFQADEHLVRRCWSVPYYRELFAKAGFTQMQEFDIEEGKRWGGRSATLTVDPWKGPYYRRWWLRK